MSAPMAAKEIAQILGVETRSVRRWATEEYWPFIKGENEYGPVRKYLVDRIPKERREVIIDKLVLETSNTEPINKQIAVAEDGLPLESKLKGWQRETMEARITLYREFERLEKKFGTNKAVKKFLSQVNQVLLPEELQKLVPVANARSGKKTGKRTLSRSTIFRWKEYASQGLSAFAPKSVECKEIPAWAPYFIKCYALPSNPTIPEAIEAMKDLLPENTPMPSYFQVARFHKKRSRLDRERGRKTGSAFKAVRGYRQRDTSELLPLDVAVCDGHSFKAKVSHPITGNPFKPEVCAVIDVATRVVTGWYTWLSESAMTVAGAVRHSVTVTDKKPYGGIPAILYTDGGSGNEADVNTNDVTGIFTRLGIEKKKGIPGNAQGRGIIEIINKTMWIRAAKNLPTFTGKDMDAKTKRDMYLIVNKDIKQKETSKHLITWPAFLEFLEQTVETYNRRPHSSLPKITDQVTGRRRHMCPLEMWSNFISQGWSQKNHQLSDQEIEMLFQPQEERTVLRSCVSLGASTYYNKDLEHYEGEVVKVSYDIHNAEKVQVWDQEDRLICYAYFEKNKSSYFPMSQVEKAREERAKRRAKIKLNQLDEIEMERRGVIDIAPVQTKVLDFKAASPQIFADREALVAEMAEEKKSEIPHGDKKRYLFWHELDDRLSLGGTLKENELKFYEAFRNSLTYKTFKEVDADLAILVHQ